MNNTRIVTWTCGVLVAIALVGCGGDDPKTQAEAAVDGQARGAQAPPVKVDPSNPCSVMFPSEVAEIIGLKSELREVFDEVTCRYHFEPAGEAPKGGDAETFIEVKVHRTDGRTAVTAARLAGQLMGGAAGGFESLPGIGDEAWLAPLASYLVFAKGDIGVEIDMRMLPNEKEKAVRLARLIAGRL